MYQLLLRNSLGTPGPAGRDVGSIPTVQERAHRTRWALVQRVFLNIFMIFDKAIRYTRAFDAQLNRLVAFQELP